jgi:hypothetical protein
LSFAFNDSEKKLETMTEALNEAYQQQNDRINQLQILFLFCTLTHKGKITVISTRTTAECENLKKKKYNLII